MAIGTPADLAAARAKLVSNSSTGKPDETIMIEFLRLVRELGVSDPEGVCEYGSYVLAKCRGHLSAGECAFLNTYNELDVALGCLKALQAQFPSSMRVKNLHGLMLEAKGELDSAAELYDSIVAEQPANTTARRRQIAVHAGHGDVTTAIDMACKYLDVFQNDPVVWEQLCQLYLQVGRLEQAQFCLEEMLILTPGDVVTMIKLADLLYEQAGAKVLAARGYYAKVIELSRGENLRALYGLLACEAFGAKVEDGKGKKGTNSEGLAELARERLRGAYGRAPEGLAVHLEALLESQR